MSEIHYVGLPPMLMRGLRAEAAKAATKADRLYVYRWNRNGRKGHTCRVTARGSLNSCRVEFDDGFVMITSRNALRRADVPAPTGSGATARQSLLPP